MKGYYGEEIAWGPMTLDEVKYELEKTPIRIERSCSDMCKYSLTRSSQNRSREFEDLTKGSGKSGKRGSSLLVDLNDTVKEMEMALLHGLDYDMPGEEEERKKSESDSQGFKVPNPVKRKIFSKSVKSKYEHVVSPVGLYIKSGEYWDDNKENEFSVNSKKLYKWQAKQK